MAVARPVLSGSINDFGNEEFDLILQQRAGRKRANDGVGNLVEQNHLSDNSRVSAVTALPALMRQQDDMSSPPTALSPAAKSRPMIGAIPSTERNSAETCIPVTRSGVPFPVRFRSMPS